MRLRGLAVHVNINVAVTATGADVTKNAPTRVRLVQAVNAGTAQNVFRSLPVPSMTANAILLGQAVLAIRAADGAVAEKTIKKSKKAHGHIGGIVAITTANLLPHVHTVLLNIWFHPIIRLRIRLLLPYVKSRPMVL